MTSLFLSFWFIPELYRYFSLLIKPVQFGDEPCIRGYVVLYQRTTTNHRRFLHGGAWEE